MKDPIKVDGRYLQPLHLQAFADGGGEGGGSLPGTGDGVPDPAAQGQAAAHDRGGQEEGTQVPSEADYDSEFQKFMERPEMKKRLGRHTREAVKSRFRAQETKSAEVRELTDLLATRYGVDPGDIGAIRKAAEADTLYEMSEAESMGVNPDTYKELITLRAMRRTEDTRRAAVEEAQKTASLRMEGERLAEEFPDFDYDTYMDDEQFRRMLDVGIDMKSAYIAKNHGKVVNATARHAARQAEERVTETVRANRSRPPEGSRQGGTPGGQEKMDFSKMSDAEFRAFRERVRSGEYIPM